MTTPETPLPGDPSPDVAVDPGSDVSSAPAVPPVAESSSAPAAEPVAGAATGRPHWLLFVVLAATIGASLLAFRVLRPQHHE